jgi:hypothetical protein
MVDPIAQQVVDPRRLELIDVIDEISRQSAIRVNSYPMPDRNAIEYHCAFSGRLMISPTKIPECNHVFDREIGRKQIPMSCGMWDVGNLTPQCPICHVAWISREEQMVDLDREVEAYALKRIHQDGDRFTDQEKDEIENYLIDRRRWGIQQQEVVVDYLNRHPEVQASIERKQFLNTLWNFSTDLFISFVQSGIGNLLLMTLVEGDPLLGLLYGTTYAIFRQVLEKFIAPGWTPGAYPLAVQLVCFILFFLASSFSLTVAGSLLLVTIYSHLFFELLLQLTVILLVQVGARNCAIRLLPALY